MINEEELSPEELWQKNEDERLEYEGYCNKIRQGLENLGDNSGERAIWELVQNARDMCKDNKANIKIELNENNLIFTHHGKEFDYTSLRALVKQDSSKDRADADLAGQYGTGFMTTHEFNRKVFVSGPYTVKKGKNEISGYVQIKDFELDRTMVDTPEGPSRMREQLEKVKLLCKQQLLVSPENDATSFRYELSSDKIEKISKQLSNVIRLMPFVLVINESIESVEIRNSISKEYFIINKKTSKTPKDLKSSGWKEYIDIIFIKDLQTQDEGKSCICKSLKSDKGDVIIIPPFPTECGDVKNIPSLFLWFPLLGTEQFGVNFIFHSKRFYPVEARNNIMLPGSTISRKEKGGKNAVVLNEMTDVLISYFEKDKNAHLLDISMCEISFPSRHDDDETLQFYNNMQDKWIKHIQNWEILPIGETHKSISDSAVKLLHPDFYKNLDNEMRKKYENILFKYASLPKDNNGSSYLMPSENLISWSETIDKWRCNNNSDFFITIADVCKAIKTKTEDLHTFLMLMKDGKNNGIMDSYALLPNRNGKLLKKSELYHGTFMTDDVYNLVNIVMGDEVNKVYDPTFLDICSSIGIYSENDLYKAIYTNMSKWRNSTLVNKTKLSQQQLDALIKFCSATSQKEFKNQRGRMMPILVKFYNKDFEKINMIKLLEDEEEFYNAAFIFLLDYTLYQISQKEPSWVKENKQWLLEFTKEYTANNNKDRLKKLEEYGIIPNQLGVLCVIDGNLHKNNGVPEDMANIYKTVFEQDLHRNWIDEDFKDFVKLPLDKPHEIASKIEMSLVADMKQESNLRKFSKVVREIILKIGKSQEWENWFSQINEKKATYTFSMKSGDAQASLFSLMDLEDKNLERLAKLNESCNIELLLDKMEHQQHLQYESDARFNHLYMIGKYIENILHEKIDSELFKVTKPEKNNNNEMFTDDIQDGQDIVISIKKEDKWEDIYFIEVKSKWDFSEPAHMSTRQIRKAALNPHNYALCCVDLRKYKENNLLELTESTIINSTKVKLDIGTKLAPMVHNIIDVENISDDIQIKITDYRSNISARIFEQGVPFQELIDKIINTVKQKIN